MHPDIEGDVELKGKRVLLCDDTTYTGVTLKKMKEHIENNLGAERVDTMTMWMSNKFVPTHYFSHKRVPLIWEWGFEVD